MASEIFLVDNNIFNKIYHSKTRHCSCFYDELVQMHILIVNLIKKEGSISQILIMKLTKNEDTLEWVNVYFFF